ncbi:MAG: hypothetical protein IT450_08420 [Phycisphaerales bacterium]|nr:hypothetical protein [Phycisphaerales bacterium]
MTTTNDQHRKYKVLMHHEVGDALDESFSGPMDGAIAVAQVYDQLPLMHRSAPVRWWHKLIPNHVRLYRGLLDWGGVGFTYVQIGSTLHVVGAGEVDRGFRADALLPAPDVDKYIANEANDGGGVSILTIG